MWIDEVLICPCLNADKALKQTQLPVDTWPTNGCPKQNHTKKNYAKIDASDCINYSVSLTVEKMDAREG
jgi:hypothetical protein